MVSKLLKRENVSSSLKKATLIAKNVFEKSFIASASEGETLKISPGNTRQGETVFKNIDSQGVRTSETFALDLGTLIET